MSEMIKQVPITISRVRGGWMLWLVGAVAWTGCASDGGGDCHAAAGKLEACTGRVPANFEEKCATGGSEDVLDADCSTLAAAQGEADAKADGYFGWKGPDASCYFNFECEGDLVCRPTRFHDALVDPGDYRKCQPKAEHGQYCDHRDDCRAAEYDEYTQCRYYWNPFGTDEWTCLRD